MWFDDSDIYWEEMGQQSLAIVDVCRPSRGRGFSGGERKKFLTTEDRLDVQRMKSVFSELLGRRVWDMDRVVYES